MSGEMNGRPAAARKSDENDGSGPVDVLIDHDRDGRVSIKFGQPVECLVMGRLEATQFAAMILKNAGCTNVQFEMIQPAQPQAQPKEST